MNTSMYSRKALVTTPLIGGWSIFDTKWHHNPHKSPPNLSLRQFCVGLLMGLIFDDILKTRPKRYKLRAQQLCWWLHSWKVTCKGPYLLLRWVS
jgi:hypothetical protein